MGQQAPVYHNLSASFGCYLILKAWWNQTDQMPSKTFPQPTMMRSRAMKAKALKKKTKLLQLDTPTDLRKYNYFLTKYLVT
jgi:hypothetical protein